MRFQGAFLPQAEEDPEDDLHDEDPKKGPQLDDVPHENRDAEESVHQSEKLSPKGQGDYVTIA